MEKIESIEGYSYTVLVVGTLLDQITTKIGLNRLNLHEANFIAKNLIGLGVWSYIDIAICALFIILSHKAYRIVLKRQNKMIFIFPLVSGSIRLLVGIWNISIF